MVVLLAMWGGLVISLATGGRLTKLGTVGVRRLWLLVVAAAAQAIPSFGLIDLRVGLAVSSIAAAAFVVFNRSIAGLGLIAAGFVANAVAVLANAGVMPVNLDAVARIGASNVSLLTDSRHVPANSHTHLRALTDEIAVPFPVGTGEVLSLGDVLVAAGAGLVVFAATRRRVPGLVHGEKGTQEART